MKKFKTVNNWVCQNFITALANGNYRSCAFIIYNTFDECLEISVKDKMLRYFFDLLPAISIETLRKQLPLEVGYYIHKLYLKYYMYYEKD